MNSKLTDLQKLNQMGITLWQARDPSHFATFACNHIQLPAQCKLLYISHSPPSTLNMTLFTNILSAISLAVEEAFYLPAEAVTRVTNPPLWNWFAGVTPCGVLGRNILHSCDLKTLEYNRAEKSRLWQQIKSYGTASST